MYRSLSHFSILVALGTLFIATAPGAEAQTPEEEVLAVINRLFDGMRAGDSTAVRSVFHETARMMTAFERDGTPVLQEGSVDRFVTAVGTPHDQVWNEKIWDEEVRVDGNLATAWTPYAFYLGDTFSHCGVNTFKFFRGTGGWQIIHLADTRYREGCDVPEDR